MSDSPMLTPEAIRDVASRKYPMATSNRWLEGRIRDEVERDLIAFFAAQDREALAGVAHRALLDLHRGAAVYVQARAVIDALLGPERTMTQ